MFLDDVLVARRIDAVDLVVGHVALEPLDVRAEFGDDAIGLLADVSQLVGRKPSGARELRSITYLGILALPPYREYL
jgi:hypothetical protein